MYNNFLSFVNVHTIQMGKEKLTIKLHMITLSFFPYIF